MYTVSAAEFTAEGTSDILVNKYIPLWGCPASLLSDNGLQFCSKLSLSVHKFLAMRKIATSAYHPNGNGGVERVNHTMAQNAGDGRQQKTRRQGRPLAARAIYAQQVCGRRHRVGPK